MNAITNLPPQSNPNSEDEVKTFFNKFFTQQISFPSNQIDAVLGFFLKNGFEEQAAKSTAIVLLNQARIDNVNPMQLVDSLKELNGVQLSQVVTEIINLYREKTSFLGYKNLSSEVTYESRNIAQ